MPDEMLALLKEHLSEDEYALLLRATEGGRQLPFDPDPGSGAEAILIDADDALLELFARCEGILEIATKPRSPSVRSSPEQLVFTFEEGGAQLEHFLGSLMRNGFAASAVEAGETHVFVHLEAMSDLEFHRAAEVVRSLYEVSAIAVGKRLRGHRLD